MAGGELQIPWYATVFRGDAFAAALEEIAPLAMRYGATRYEVYRSRDDRYKFLQTARFEEKLDFERYWAGPEFSEWRARFSSYFQVPVVYGWHDIIAAGVFEPGDAWGEPVQQPAADAPA
jgi:quinol monooxygenase YgiN